MFLATFLRPQLGAAIDMLANAMRACPEPLWNDRSKRPQVWYLAYHTVLPLDLSLSGSAEGLSPPAPFELDELDPDAPTPERAYSKLDNAPRWIARVPGAPDLDWAPGDSR